MGCISLPWRGNLSLPCPSLYTATIRQKYQEKPCPRAQVMFSVGYSRRELPHTPHSAACAAAQLCPGGDYTQPATLAEPHIAPSSSALFLDIRDLQQGLLQGSAARWGKPTDSCTTVLFGGSHCVPTASPLNRGSNLPPDCGTSAYKGATVTLEAKERKLHPSYKFPKRNWMPNLPWCCKRDVEETPCDVPKTPGSPW